MIRWASNTPATVTIAGTFGAVSVKVPAGSGSQLVRL
jgi:hypothetical protein